jgi:hypothetical protein
VLILTRGVVIAADTPGVVGRVRGRPPRNRRARTQAAAAAAGVGRFLPAADT